MKRSRMRILLPLAILLISFGLIFATRVISAANHLLVDLNAMQSFALDSGSLSARFDSLEPLLSQTSRDYRDLRGALGPTIYLAPLLSWLPKYGGNFENAPALFDLGDRIVASAENALPVLNSFDATKEGLESPTAAFLQVVNGQKNVLDQSRRDYLETSRARVRINTGKLSPFVHQMIERVDEFLLIWQVGLDAASIAPAQLGEDRPRVYLLLAQNSDELRPTGGFISSVALVRVNRGEISVTDFQDSYAVDDLSRFHPQPPPALSKYMFAGLLLLRDTNWYPDFPTTARAAQNIYRVDRGIATDGVIAVNLKGIPRLLEAVGPVTVEPGGERVDASNVMTKLRTYWAPAPGAGLTPEWWSRRKDFMGQLLDAVMQRYKRGEFSRVRLARALADSIASKDLLIYLKDMDDGKQSKFLWSGALTSGPSDALMIVDSNVGFNKVDANIDRRAEYSATLDGNGAIHALVTIAYTNLSAPDGKPCLHQPYYPPTYAELQQGCYWDYVRVIAPRDSRLISADGISEPVTEPTFNDRAVFGGFLVLARGETRTVRFEYSTPPNSEFKSHYTLIWEKQPGAPNFPAQFHLTLPPGMIARSANPAPISQSGNTAQFSFSLDHNQSISVEADSLLASLTGWIVLGAGILIVMSVLVYRRRRTMGSETKALSESVLR